MRKEYTKVDEKVLQPGLTKKVTQTTVIEFKTECQHCQKSFEEDPRVVLVTGEKIGDSGNAMRFLEYMNPAEYVEGADFFSYTESIYGGYYHQLCFLNMITDIMNRDMKARKRYNNSLGVHAKKI